MKQVLVPGMVKEMAEKKDKRKFFLNTIYFYLTDGCNLRCRHCWIATKYGSSSYPSLSLELFRSIIKQAKPLGLSEVKLTGGEPLLHPQFHEILDFVRSENLRLVVETNGVLCTPEIAQEMASCKNPFVSVSLDGVDAETHEWIRRVSGCFVAAKEGIRNLVKAGFKPQIIMTIMRHNKGQIEPIVRLAESLGVGSVKFNIVLPIGRGKKMQEAGETMTIEELVDLGRWVENTLSASTSLSLQYSHPLAFRPLGKMFGKNGDGFGLCGILSTIGVLDDGSYALCGIGKTVPNFVFGHAANDRLEDVWNNTSVLLELREGLPNRLEGICSYCLMKGLCRGSCIAHNYYRSKNLWAPFLYCEEALNSGLFPETRLFSSSSKNKN